MIRACLAALFALLPLTAAAEDSTMLAFDLNGDGRVERFTLLPNDDTVTLQIENTGGGVIYYDDIAVRTDGSATARIEQFYPDGTNIADGPAQDRIRLVSGPGPNGEDQWQRRLIIGYRDGGYAVIGYEYVRWFPENDDWFIACELDFDGDASVFLEYDMLVPIDPQMDVMPVQDWSADSPVPEACMNWEAYMR